METALMTQKDGLITNLIIANGMLIEVIVKNMEVIMKILGR